MFELSLIFLATMGIISIPFYNKSNTAEGYFISSRKLKTPTLSFTIAATTIGGSAIIVTLKLIEKYGIWGILADIAGGVGLIILSFTLAEKVRKTKAITLPSILKNSISSSSYKFIAFGLVLAELCWLALSIKSIQILGNFTLTQTATITIGVVLYSLIGGQWSVSKTDIIQFLLIIIGLSLYFFHPALFRFTPLLHNSTDLTLIYICTLMLLSHIIGPDIYSKILSAENEKTAKKGVLGAGILKIFFSVLLIFSISRGFSTKNINAIVFITVFSALVSSLDSMLITVSSIICEDLLKTENKIIIKTSTVFAALFSFFIAMKTPQILSLLKSGYTILLIIIAFPTISFFTKGEIPKKTIVIPPIIFIIAYFIFKSPEISFLVSLLAGGITVAYTKIHR